MVTDVARLTDDELADELAKEKRELAKMAIDDNESGVAVVDIARSAIGQGLAFGLGDEIEAFATSLVKQARGEDTDYDTELESVRAQIANFREQNPGAALTSEIIGSLLVPGGVGAAALRQGATLGRLALRGTAIGGVSGGAAGFGAGEGGAAQRLQSAAVGTAVGGAAGAVATPAIQGLTRGAQLAGRALSRPGAQREATEMAARQMTDVDVGQVQAAAQRAQAAGVDPNIIEATELASPGTSRGLVGTARAATSLPGPAQVRASRILEDRQIQQPAQVTEFIDDAFGAADFEQTAARLSERISNQARADYRALHALPDVEVDADLAAILSNKDVRRAVKGAQRLAAAEGEELAIAAPVARAVREGEPQVQRITARDFGLEGTTVPVKTLDFLQRALRTETLGPPSTKTVAKGRLRSRLLNALDQRIDGFQDIRTRYADGKASEEAMDLGQRLVLRLGAKQRETLSKFERMDEPQQQLFRLGVARGIKDELANRPQGITRKLNTPAAQEALRRILPPNTADRLIDQAEALGQQSATRGRIGVGAQQGSRTTPLAEERADMGENAQLAANILLGRPIATLQGIAQRTARGIDRKNAEEVVNLMLESNPDELERIFTQIRQAQENMARSQAQRGATAISATSAVGQTAGREEARRRATSR